MKSVDKTSALIIQQKLIERFRGVHGLRDVGAVKSVAAYACHVSLTHAFLDGNKRIAAAVAGVFLDIAASKSTREETEEKFAGRLDKSE